LLEGLLLAVGLAGCHSLSRPQSCSSCPSCSGGASIARAGAETLPGGVVPSSYQVVQATPASRELVVIPPPRRASRLVVLGRPNLSDPPADPSSSSAPTHPAAELLPITVPGAAFGPGTAGGDDWRFAGQVAAGRRVAELETPTALPIPSENPAAREVPAENQPALLSPQILVINPLQVTRRCPSGDPTGHPAFAHAADYSWLVGVLQEGSSEDTWSVRYAGRDEDDRFGGVLTLVGAGLLSDYHLGQLVRVEGDLVDPAPHEIKPAYHVRAIQHLQRP
jgi:hypothetical protein